MKRFSVSLLLFSSALLACQAPISSDVPQTPETQSSSPASIKTLTVGASPHGIAATADFVYNSNTADKSLSVIDSHSDTVVKTIALESSPGYSKASHDGKYILVLSNDDANASQLHIFDPAQDHQLIRSLTVGQGADKIQISDDDQHVYVSLAGEAGIAHYHFAQGLGEAPAERRLIPAGAGTNDGHGHRALASDTSWLLTPNPGDNSSSLISPEGQTQILRDGNNPAPVALGMWNGELNKALVGNSASHTVSLFTPGSENPITLSDIGQSPTDIATVPALGRAYVTMAGSNQVAVIDYVNGKVLGTVKTQQRPVHLYVAPAKSNLTIQHEGHDHGEVTEIWVGNDAGASVTVFDAQTLEVLAHHPTGVGHHKMAFSQNKAYISNITDGTLTVITR